MSNEEASKGWLVHTASRRFGPLTEEEIRSYFRAGMVKSVDRVSAPGEFVRRDAAEVARELGEPVPVGPPPPPVEEEGLPSAAAAGIVAPTAPPPAREADKPLDPRAMQAIAQLHLQMATARPPSRKIIRWLAPTVIVILLILAMVIGLNMLKHMQPRAAASTLEGPTGYQPAPAPAAESPTPVAPAGAAAVAAGAVDFQAERQRAQELEDAKQWPELAAHASQWSQKQPERIEPWQFLGLAQSQRSDFGAAATAFGKASELDPGNDDLRLAHADALLAAGRHAEAAALYAKLVATQPGNSLMWNSYGQCLRALGQEQQAVAALETATRLDPTFKAAWKNLGETYRAMGDGARASAAFANAR